MALAFRRTRRAAAFSLRRLASYFLRTGSVFAVTAGAAATALGLAVLGLRTSRLPLDNGLPFSDEAARELLLAQSSDWAFIMKTGTMVEYAVRRTKEHVLRFTRLHDQVRSGTIDEGWLGTIEYRDNIFPEIDYRVYRPL